jgi:hypothetical protein
MHLYQIRGINQSLTTLYSSYNIVEINFDTYTIRGSNIHTGNSDRRIRLVYFAPFSGADNLCSILCVTRGARVIRLAVNCGERGQEIVLNF